MAAIPDETDAVVSGEQIPLSVLREKLTVGSANKDSTMDVVVDAALLRDVRETLDGYAGIELRRRLGRK